MCVRDTELDRVNEAAGRVIKRQEGSCRSAKYLQDTKQLHSVIARCHLRPVVMKRLTLYVPSPVVRAGQIQIANQPGNGQLCECYSQTRYIEFVARPAGNGVSIKCDGVYHT